MLINDYSKHTNLRELIVNRISPEDDLDLDSRSYSFLPSGLMNQLPKTMSNTL